MDAASTGVVVDDLTVRYGDLTAVDRASFVAPRGAVTVILGPNGAGKTSTIEVCEGYRRADSGAVSVLGLDPRRDHRTLTTMMGVMLQDGGVYPAARVLETVTTYCDLHRSGVDAVALVDLVGLSHRRSSPWRRLSGGERQRLSLALALAARPRVAFLDEPTSGIDIDGRDTVRSIVRDLVADGVTVVIATHDLDEAERIADNVVIFGAGRVLVEGSLTSLRSDRHRVSFRSRSGLDLAALSQAIGASVTRLDVDAAIERSDRHSLIVEPERIESCWYSADSPDEARLVAALGGWLAEHNEPLHEMRSGTESLADLYRRVTSGDRT